jgi:20S proteasome alpha/beta subunit
VIGIWYLILQDYILDEGGQFCQSPHRVLLPKTKPKWTPRSPKNMTLVAGFVCRDGILMCADMEQEEGDSSRRVSKLSMRSLVDTWTYVTAGAGSAPVIDNAVKKLGLVTKDNLTQYDESKMEELMNLMLQGVYSKYVWPDQRTNHSINLIVAFSDATSLSQALWVTHDLVPMPERKFVCAGSGQDLANYFADQIWHPMYSEQQAVRVAAFIFQEVKNHVRGVGQGTEMWMLRKGGKNVFYNRHEIQLIEEGVSSFQRTLIDYGHSITGPSLFPILPFTVDVPYTELVKNDGGMLKGRMFINARKIKQLTFK